MSIRTLTTSRTNLNSDHCTQRDPELAFNRNLRVCACAYEYTCVYMYTVSVFMFTRYYNIQHACQYGHYASCNEHSDSPYRIFIITIQLLSRAFNLSDFGRTFDEFSVKSEKFGSCAIQRYPYVLCSSDIATNVRWRRSKRCLEVFGLWSDFGRTLVKLSIKMKNLGLLLFNDTHMSYVPA